MSIKVEDLSVGDIFYECSSGFNIKARVDTKPVVGPIEVNGKIHNQWSWTATNLSSQNKIEYLITEGLEHYGPKLYKEPQYARFVGGEPIFEYV